MNTVKDKQYQSKATYCLSITNKHISKQVETLGLVKAKSLKVTFPTFLPDSLIPHFVRGYFDGNGSVNMTKAGQLSISILGTTQFCETLKKHFLKHYSKNSIVCHAKKVQKLVNLLYMEVQYVKHF